MNRHELSVYFIMGSANSEEPLQLLEQALLAGITCFQLREKGEAALTGEALEAFAKSCQKLCRQYHVPFIINDYVELAVKIQADGVHIGQDDIDLTAIRQRLFGKIIGVSVHTSAEMEAALQGGADYVGIGPIYETTSKADAKPASGVQFLTTMRTMYPQFPIVGIGGIKEANAKEVIEAGADGVAVISVICDSLDLVNTVRLLKLS